MTNRYSAQWFDTFLATIPDRATADEVAFVERQLPVAAFPRLLDLCCGPARHACAFSERGYRVVGVDRDEVVIRRASSLCPNAEFRVCDMRAFALKFVNQPPSAVGLTLQRRPTSGSATCTPSTKVTSGVSGTRAK